MENEQQTTPQMVMKKPVYKTPMGILGILAALLVVIGGVWFGFDYYQNQSVLPTEQQQEVPSDYETQFKQVNTTFSENVSSLNILMEDPERLFTNAEAETKALEKIETIQSLRSSIEQISPPTEKVEQYEIWKTGMLVQIEAYQKIGVGVRERNSALLREAASELESSSNTILESGI